MAYKVIIGRKVLRKLPKLPEVVQKRFDLLYEVLHRQGPAGPHQWHNYGKLGENEYHCHLNYSYVACWRHEKKTIIIEVYYAGSR
jgi:mRNA-degrading endonuclease RelE of RelBE toxin-antitoxin system